MADSNSRLDALKTFTRKGDGKVFQAAELLHWTPVEADDGEQDLIKFYGGGNGVESFVGFDSGATFTRARK